MNATLTPRQPEGSAHAARRAGPRRPEAAAPAARPIGSSGAADEHLVSLLVPNSIEGEQYRALRHQIEQRHKDDGLTVVAISSPTPADGKTTTAINLAGALAQDPQARVLLVDGDLRVPSVSEQLGLGEVAGPGLVEAILDPGRSLDDVVRDLPLFNLSVLPAGRSPSAPYEVLKSPRLGDLFQEARRRFDYILVDTPPIVPVPDCRVISKWVDGFMVVVAAHKTPRRLLQEALNVTEPGKLMGLVFNRDERLLTRAYGYYGYGQQHGRARVAERGRGGAPRSQPCP